jgi:uncharacterized protein YyaL (SSP411 family)
MDSLQHLDNIDHTTLPQDGGPDFNRLIFTQSPYLLQHATNPVDWHPWGEEALSLATTQNKPIFLSIGYSTCHWCHVMAHESFEDETVAGLLKEHFVAIKVDREERPDIDNVYMTACQLMTGSGGWPLTLLLTPDKQPFFAATYLPREPRGGQHGLINLLEKVAELWEQQPHQVKDSAEQLTATLQRIETRPAESSVLEESYLRRAMQSLRDSFDTTNAGFGTAPKFPTPHNLSLLFRLAQRQQTPDAGMMATATLKAIRSAGIYDQFGYGLHRYAVDSEWQVPHFEKMLYDQALFIQAGLDAYQSTGDDEFAEIVTATIDYILKDLSIEEGVFCCGEDADSEGVEGTFYLWTLDQVHTLLDKEVAELCCLYWGITDTGNFEGKNIPHIAISLEELAASKGLSIEQLSEALEKARKILLAERSKRMRPHRDDKILTCWNGLAIAAIARGGTVLNRTDWITAAERAMSFLLETMPDSRGRLRRCWRKGEAAIPGFAEDYCFLIWGLLELLQASFKAEYLEAARHWTDKTLELFDDGCGGLWDTGSDAERVLGRGRTVMDGAIPAAGSIFVLNLLRLSDLTGEQSYRERAESLLANHLGRMGDHPEAHCQLLSALDYALGPTQQLVLCSPSDLEQAAGLLHEACRRYLPNTIILASGTENPGLNKATALFTDRAAHQGRATAYLCREQSCQQPVQSPSELARLLDRSGV